MSIEENLALALLRGKARGLSRSVTPTRRLIFLEALRAIGMGLEVTDQLVRSHGLCALLVTHNMEQAIR